MRESTVIDSVTRTIRPATPEGDDHFGLTPCSAGTAGVTRRALITPPGYTWTLFSGKTAKGLQFQPSSMTPEQAVNPWDGRIAA